ncbi:MAG: hypothetical protein HBSAPP03_11510 [Phycisphaerae bacterium]|nr:MAG: hypothetical protein HBSAPP03_11510 [Phycisphaerae bacterium]
MSLLAALCGRGEVSLRSGVVLSLLAACSAQAGIITDTAYFTPFPHTKINFETDGAGSTIGLIQGQTQVMPLNAYSNLGVDFLTPVRWVNDGNAAFDAAQILGGSPANAIPSSFVSSFSFAFTVPVRAMGMFVVNNRLQDAAGPTFSLYDTQNVLITTVQFGGVFVDDTITIPNTTADYGFMGFEADRDIARVEVTKVHAIFDDLYFTAVPAPGVLALAGVGLGLVSRRARRMA